MKRCMASHSPGVALVVTLMMMSILVMMVVGLAGVMRNEQAAARNLTYQVLADQMADLGAREAMAVVLSNSAAGIGTPSATGPGWMRSKGALVPLFSSNPAAQLKNLEEIGTNSLILSLPDPVRGGVRACWSNVLPPLASQPIGRYAWWVDDEGSKVNLNAVGPNNTSLYLPLLTNFPISADYIFVTNPVTGGTNAATRPRAQALAGRANAFVTVEGLKDTNIFRPSGNEISGSIYRRCKGHVTAWSSNVDLTPWGTPKLNLADPSLTAAQIKAAIATNAWTNIFGNNMTLARKYGGGALTAGAAGNAGDIVLDQIVANIQSARGSPVANTLANISSPPSNTNYLRHRYLVPTAPYSLTNAEPLLNEFAASVSSLDTSIGSTPSISITVYLMAEIFNPWGTPATNGYTVEIQPRKMRFHIGYNISTNLTPSVFPNYGTPWADSDGPSAGISGSKGCWVGPMLEDLNPWPLGMLQSFNIPSCPARSWASKILPVTFNCTFSKNGPTNMAVDQAYLMFDRIVLKDNLTGKVLDSITYDDFSQAANFGGSNTWRWTNQVVNDWGQLNFNLSGAAANYAFATNTTIATSISTNGGSFNPSSAQGLAKNDPLVRLPVIAWDDNTALASWRPGAFKVNGFPSTLRAWKRVGGTAGAVTPGAHNAAVFDATNTNGSVTGIPYLWPDPAPSVSSLTNHPHFVAGYQPTNGFRSVAELGAIHTGLPWRTLRFQSQPSVERDAASGATNSPPDWILLDVFTATNPINPRVMVNMNGFPTAFGGSATNSDGSISSRAFSLASIMGAAATSASGANAGSNGVCASLTNTNSTYGGMAGLQAIASNLATKSTNLNSANAWVAGSGWGAQRVAQSSNFPANGFLLSGEVLEMAGVAQDTTSPASLGEDVIEGRLRTFLDLVTTRSDTFTVWSAGQGLVVNTNRGNRTNVMAEVRKQTVFQRIPVFNPAGTTVTGYQLKILYTRNHVVE